MSVVAENIRFAYNSQPVLNDINIHLEPSEMIGIIGPNGSGKTTMLKLMNRLLSPRRGRILIDSQDISRMKQMDIAKTVGYVPQRSEGQQSSPTVFEVVMMGRRPHSSWHSGRNDEDKVWTILSSLELMKMASKRFDELSGGERQKVLIARALVQEATTLLLDEPTSNLDIKHQVEVMNLLSDLVKNKGISVCTVVHDLDLAMKYCDKTVLMKEGKIFASGITHEVITSKNVKSVYDVDVIIDRSYGRPHVVVV